MAFFRYRLRALGVRIVMTLACVVGMVSSAYSDFRQAKPVWVQGKEKESNLLVGFRSEFECETGERVSLRVAASTVYRVFLNGVFLGYGPARGPHGYFRVDEWDLKGHARSGGNVVAIEVVGYNVNSYYLINQPSFVQAEVVADRGVLAYTGEVDGSFNARILPQRVQKVQRYSFQRPFVEYYRLTPGSDGWRRGDDTTPPLSKIADQSQRSFLERRIPFPRFSCKQPTSHVAGGTVITDATPASPFRDRSLVSIGPTLGGFPESDLEVRLSADVERMATLTSNTLGQEWTPSSMLVLPEKGFHLVDFGHNLTGFIGAKVRCTTATRLILTFDEILSNGDVNFTRLGAVNAIGYELLQPGEYSIESIEPYTLRFLKLIAPDAGLTVTDVYVREYANDDVWSAEFASSDLRLNQLFSAARETFRQNSVDLFMDCPSRERAGWLCDSFFTARFANALCGNALMETNFLENFQKGRFDYLPDGMLPMCYPSDHNNGNFIPNWALWFVVELEEYVARSGDREGARLLEPRVMALLDFFRKYRNEEGLLEKLPGWIFVEWSDANSFVQDVNYPTNMLYAGALEAAGRIYGRPDLQQEAQALRARIIELSFDGEFFVDNAVREDKKLKRTQNRSEACQYYAFMFGTATADRFSKLWQVLLNDFGPQRAQTKAYPDIRPANAFMGHQLRLELLSRAGESQRLAEESLGYYLKMAQRTGTLWEHDSPSASCNHGFASHAGFLLYRDVLGIYAVDPVARVVQLRIPKIDLDWCEGRIPVADGFVTLKWRKEKEQDLEQGRILYRVSVPAGFTLKVDNLSGRQLVRVDAL